MRVETIMPDRDKFYQKLLNSIFDGVYFVDVEKKVTYWNKGAERISGYSAEEMLGLSCPDKILVHVDDRGTDLCKGKCPLSETMTDDSMFTAEVYLNHKDGHRVPVIMGVSSLRDEDGKCIGGIEVFRESVVRTIDKQLIEELKKSALLDPLTELANRRYVNMKLRASFEELHRHGIPFGLIMGDIDFFKNVNDTWGHAAGDGVLQMISRILEGNRRASDMAGRWGGDEFIFIASHIEGGNLGILAEKLRKLVENCTVIIKSTSVKVTMTLGGTQARTDDTIELLTERADRFLYRGKSSGRNLVIVDEKGNDISPKSLNFPV